MKRKVFLTIGISFLVIYSGPGMLVAQPLWDYSRPDPLMDYVAQEMGTYDTVYEALEVSDCRGCHTGVLTPQHHSTDLGTEDSCDTCHSCGDPEECVVRNCLADGCHSWNDVSINGWHHYTESSDSGNCGACHALVPIQEFGAGRRFADDPPKISPPTPYSCENCHWCQEASATGDPDDPGHPSTHDHYDEFGNWVGFYEYGKHACSPYDTHHMGFEGNIVVNKCYVCHGFGTDWDSADVDWNPDNPERIRHCEKCHTPETLHHIHVEYYDAVQRDCYGWEAAGFHVDETGAEPSTYRSFTLEAYEMCRGCHLSMLVLAPVANPSILWPSNHEMTDITVEANARNLLGPAVTLTATVTSSEPIEGLGGGDMTPDWTEPVIDQAQGIITLKLRAERGRLSDGRIYTISITATDSTGWNRTQDVQVIAPRKNPKL